MRACDGQSVWGLRVGVPDFTGLSAANVESKPYETFSMVVRGDPLREGYAHVPGVFHFLRASLSRNSFA